MLIAVAETWVHGSLIGRDQVGRLLMPELDVVAEHIDIKQLPDIFLPVVICKSKGKNG